VNCLKPTGSRAFDVRKDVVEKKNALRGHSNGLKTNRNALASGFRIPILYDTNISLK